MKELSIEEKAKRYDEAIEIINDYYQKIKYSSLSNASTDREVLEKAFPQLKESEDERMSKYLIKYFEANKDELSKGFKWNGITVEECLAWLEKQGEQNQEWGEEDEKFVHGLIRGLTAKRDIHGHTTFSSDCIDITKTISWLKALKERIQPQLKREWSEDDEENLIDAIKYLELFDAQGIHGNKAVPCINWLKALKERHAWKKSLVTADLENSLCDMQDGYSDTSREYRILGEAIEFIRCTEPQPHWEPSDEQITWLYRAADDASKDSRMKQVLNELLKQLKKLRGE